MNIKLQRNILGCLLLLGLVLWSAKKFFFNNSGGQFQRQPSDDYNKLRNSIVDSLPVSNNDIVFVGTSLTQNFPLDEFFPGMNIRNRGTGGNYTDHIKARIGLIARQRPRIIFLEAGVNDLMGGLSVEQVFVNMATIIDTAQAYSRVIIEQCLPVRDQWAYLQPKIDSLNNKLSAYCAFRKIECLKIDLSKDGFLNPLFSADGIHINYSGYRIWAQTIKVAMR